MRFASKLLALLGVAAAGCGNGHTMSAWFSRPTPRQLLATALEDRRPDERRKAVSELARSADAASDWAIKAFDTIARTDPDPMVRVEAIRGLARSGGRAAAATLIKLLSSADAPLPDVHPPAPGPLRWEAAMLLEALLAQGKIADADRESALSIMLSRADHDPDRNVRLTAVTALRHFRDRRVLPALVAALRTRDFAVQHRAEQSLHVLTAQSHDHDPDAWERGLAGVADPIAPAHPSPPPRSWWSRLVARS